MIGMMAALMDEVAREEALAEADELIEQILELRVRQETKADIGVV